MSYRPLPMMVNVGGTVLDINKAPSTLRIEAYNHAASQLPAFVQLFNAKAADVTLGTTQAYYTFQVSPGDNEVASADLHFSIAVSVACTSTATGSTAALCDISPAVR